MLAKILRLGIVVSVLGLLASAVVPLSVRALDVPPKPTDIPVVDQTNTLTDAQKNTLAQQIASEREKTGNQIAVVMISTLENESIEDYSLKVAREWGIGTKENNNGVLLLIAKDDRRLRIEVGTGLEGALTDVQAGQIIRNDITPSFKQDDYYGGIRAGLSSIIAAIHGEYVAAPEAESEQRFPWEGAFMFAIMGFVWLGSILARTKSWWAGGVIGGVAGGGIGLLIGSLTLGLVVTAVLIIIGLLFDKSVSSNYQSRVSQGRRPSWWAGGTHLGGGGFGGGGGGFGGGSFGGGGASGGW